LKTKLYRIAYGSLWILLVINLLAGLGFVGSAQDSRTCEEVSFEITGLSPDSEQLTFVSQGMLEENICEAFKITSIQGQPITKLNSNKIEQILCTNPYIKTVQSYEDISGKLYIKAEQKKPILRILTDQLDYYITEDGTKLPPSLEYTARVAVVTGHFFEGIGLTDSMVTDMGKQLYTLGKTVNESKLWRAQIEQIYIDENDEIILIPKLGNQQILIGNVEDLSDKLNRLEVFYSKVLNTKGWNAYKIINLKFKNQVVCTK
jgi:cell division protein FtsQ